MVLYTRAGQCMPLILVIFGQFLALVIGYVWKACRAAWHGGMFTWMFIFHVKRDTNCSLYVRRLGMGLLKPPHQAG